MGKGDEIKYGQVRGGSVSTAVPMAASQSANINNKSGKFVYIDSGQAKMCADGITEIVGWIEASSEVTYAAGDEVNCVVDPSAVFIIPINSGTFTADMVGKTCDISISSNIQGAQLDASAEDTLYIVGGDLVDNAWVEVMINDIKQRAVGVV